MVLVGVRSIAAWVSPILIFEMDSTRALDIFDYLTLSN